MSDKTDLMGFAAIGILGYLFLNKAESAFNSLGTGFTSFSESIRESSSEIYRDTVNTFTEILTPDPNPTYKNEDTQKAINVRKEPGQEWSLESSTIKQVENYSTTPGGWMEEHLQNENSFAVKLAKNWGLYDDSVPTGVLSEGPPSAVISRKAGKFSSGGVSLSPGPRGSSGKGSKGSSGGGGVTGRASIVSYAERLKSWQDKTPQERGKTISDSWK